jgi:ADP-dependent NAD(P)H-hydrate dehydratase / NAD(P)H-hydrate epimerase
MIPIITPQVMLEEEAIWNIQDPIKRIETSAKALFEALVEVLEPDQHLILLCGKGLNGADTFCLARLLYEAGFDITVHALFDKALFKNETLYFYDALKSYDVIKPFEMPLTPGRYVHIDGIFGAGFKGEVPSDIAQVIDKCNAFNSFKVAIDIPSGIDGENGTSTKALECDLTLSIGLPKWGLFIHKGRYHSGHIKHVEIGLKKTIASKKSLGFLATEEALFSYLPKEKSYFHKYQKGQVLGLASSPSYIGACFFYTKAAYRIGAGLVRVFHDKNSSFFTTLAPEVTQHEFSEFDKFLDKQKTACVVGPGLIMTNPLNANITKILDKKIPCVIDGGALETISLEKLHAHVVLTPHIDELKKLLKTDTSDFDELLKLSSNHLLQSGLTLIIKGHHSWILHQDKKPVIFAFAPLAMATAGSGDVLAGIIGGYLSKALSSFDAAILSVGIHSLAGKIATFDKSKKAIMAQDILEALPEALNTI